MLLSRLIIAAVVSLAAADYVRLKAYSQSRKLQGFLVKVPEGEENFYFTLGATPTVFYHQDDKLFVEGERGNLGLHCTSEFLTSNTEKNPDQFLFDFKQMWDVNLRIWVCSNVNGPNKVPIKSKIIMVTKHKPGNDCMRINLVLDPISESIALQAYDAEKKQLIGSLVATPGTGGEFLTVRETRTNLTYLKGLLYKWNKDNSISKLGVKEGFLFLAKRIEPVTLKYDDYDFLESDTQFWGCMNVGDPKSKTYPMILVVAGEQKHLQCFELKLKIFRRSGNTINSRRTNHGQWNGHSQ